MNPAPIIVLLVAAVTGCATPKPVPDPFADKDQFAAARQLETRVYSDIEADLLFQNLVDILLDMDCAIEEINRSLGLVSGSVAARVRYANSPLQFAHNGSCLNSDITVVMSATGSGANSVRATFSPTSNQRRQTFNSLLERSLQQSAMEK